MSHHTFDGRRLARCLTGLDFGLRVQVTARSRQRAIFAGTEDLSLQALTSELAEMVSSLRVYSYALRGQLERVTSALMLNVECGEWLYARRAALDLASLLAQGQKRGLVQGSRAVRGANGALQIADLCAREVR